MSYTWGRKIETNQEEALRNIHKKIIILCTLFVLMLSGCGEEQSQPVAGERYYNPSSDKSKSTEAAEEKEETASDVVIGTDLYMIMKNDMTTEQIILKQLVSGKQYMYQYSLSTSFLDKYGDSTSVTEFELGRAVHIGSKDSNDKLKQIQIADEVWEYSDIVRYSIDAERGIFKIADTKYSYSDDIFVESNGEQIQLSDLNGKDEIRVVGIGKKILSVSVTTGQGILELQNTDVFEGSYIQIGTKIFAQITKDMQLDVPEGTYNVTVANNGYGGTTEVTVNRGETVTLDLDELKGEGPKTGKIVFYIDTENTEDAESARMEIDGKTVDYSEPVELTYGVHSIDVTADGYEDYSKKLFVNSAAANIDIEMTKTGSDTDSESTETTEEKDSESTETASTESTETTESSESSEDVTSDYLSTLSDIITSLTK